MDATEAAALGNFAAAALIQAYGARLRTNAQYTETLRAFQRL
jgi:hypothetical protein